MDIKDFVKAMKGCDKVIFKLTGVGEQEHNTEEFKEVLRAIEKKIPQQPIETQELMDIEWLCPMCGFQVGNSLGTDNYCAGCGQKID